MKNKKQKTKNEKAMSGKKTQEIKKEKRKEATSGKNRKKKNKNRT